MGVRGRLVLWNVLAIAIILVAMGAAVRYELRVNLMAQIERELEHEVAGVSTSHLSSSTSFVRAITEGESSNGHTAERRKLMIDMGKGQFKRKPGTQLTEILNNSTDQISLETDPSIPRLIPVDLLKHGPLLLAEPIDKIGYQQASLGKRLFHNFIKEGRTFRSLSTPVRTGGRILAVVQSAHDLTSVSTELNQLDRSLGMLFPLALIVSAISGVWLVGSAMRPLRRLTESARGLAPDLSDKRLPIVGSDEFAELGMAFNEALDRTAGAFSAQSKAMKQLERFTGDAGHELRTPLGAIKGSVTFLLQGRKWGSEAAKSLEIIDRASDRMNRLIGDLLLLARQDGGQHELTRTPVFLIGVVQEALEFLPNPRGIAVQVSIQSELTVIGDEQALFRVSMNLLSNALAHACTGVRVSAPQNGGWIELRVEDDGGGIAPEHLARLGERFYRPESARSRELGGTGLGLAIARSLIEAHQGSLEVQSELGKGTTAIVRLPIET